MNMINYINEQTVTLVPVLYYIGTLLKDWDEIKDKYIPLILLAIGVILSSWLMKTISPDSIIQGILATSCSTYSNQVYKQLKNK